MKEMTELATVISGAKQSPPEPVDAAASAVVRLNAIIKITGTPNYWRM